MATVYDVDPNALIELAAKELENKIKAPEWTKFVKTGPHKERPPQQENWYYLRAASLLRRLYTDGPVGVRRLRTVYGGRKKGKAKPKHFKKASGKVIRVILQQFESLGFAKKTEHGRAITPAGMSYLDKLATKVLKGGE